MAALPHAVLQSALARARRWERRKYVVGTAIGQRERGGRFLRAEQERCIIVYVDAKLPRPQLRAAGRALFPEFIELARGKRKYRVPVDVQATGALVGELNGMISTQVSIAGQPAGAVGGVVVNVQAERSLLVAGHVAVQVGRRLQLAGGLSALTRTVRMSALLDHALARPNPPEACGSCALPSGDAIAGVRAIDLELLGEPMFFQRAATGRRVQTLVRSVDASAPFPLPHRSAPVMMRGLIATRRDTTFGESGTLLYDASFQAVGTLVGVLGEKSYFVPCDTAFPRLKVALAEEPA